MKSKDINKIWLKEKDFIQTIGVLVAIGGIFLNINTPTSEIARKALGNIQLLWILAITISCFALAYRLAKDLREIDKTEVLDYLEWVVIIVSLGVVWLLWNQVLYIWDIYKPQLISYAQVIFLILLLPLLTVINEFHKKAALSKINRLLPAALIFLLYVPALSLIWSILANEFQFSVIEWGKSSFWFYMSAIVLLLFEVDRAITKKIKEDSN